MLRQNRNNGLKDAARGQVKWLDQLRNAAMLTLDEQIECCTALIVIWIEAGNLDSAESCSRIALSLKVTKYGYHSIPVAKELLNLSEIHQLQGDFHAARVRKSQSDLIATFLNKYIVSHFEQDLDACAVSYKSQGMNVLQTKHVQEFCSELSPLDLLHDASWAAAAKSAEDAINILFAA